MSLLENCCRGYKQMVDLFSSPVQASQRDWATKVDGIGKGIASKIYAAIHNQNGNGGQK